VSPFLLPTGDSSRDAAGRGNPAGFDREWDLSRRFDLDIPEEEAALELLDTKNLEINDEVGFESLDASAPEESALETVEALSDGGFRDWQEEVDPAILKGLWVIGDGIVRPLQGNGRGSIRGYATIDQRFVAIYLEELDASVVEADPTQQTSVAYGQDIDLLVHGIVRDHEDEFLQLERKDGLGRFFLDVSRTPGLDPFDREFLTRLESGSKVTGTVIPLDQGGATVSLRFAATNDLISLPTVSVQVGQTTTNYYPARIVEAPNQWNRLVIEL
jgi:hypothetical protein